MRYEVMEIHLFDTDATEEKALCETNTSVDDRRGVSGYLEDRLYGNAVGNVCERCKLLAVPFVVTLSRDLEAEGLLDEAEEYRELDDRLARETGLDRRRG